MKKLVLFIFSIFSAFSVFAVTLEVAPYNGAYGIPIASPYYQGGSWDDPEKPTDGFDDINEYSNSEIIAVGGIQNLSESEYNSIGGELKVTVTCPNGFYLISQSNPAFKRPFELQLIWTDARRYEQRLYYTGGNTPVAGSNWEKIDDNQWKKDYEKDIISNEGSPEKSGTLRDWILEDEEPYSDTEIFKYRNQFIDFWCDLILILPGEILSNSDTLLVKDGNRNIEYPLIEADDYTAIVTITFEYGDLPPESITIPFSGYYRRGEYDKSDDVCSLLVTPTAEAAHLSIPEDRGTWQTVGNLEFMLSTFRTYSTSPYTDSPVIFASSSRDPEDSTADIFRLVHESVDFNTPLTQTNSIEYEVRIRKTQGLGTSSYVFDGTGSIDDVNTSHPGTVSPYGIVPKKESAKLNHTNQMDYYSYAGVVEVMLEPGTNVMYAGRYSGTVYIHVVADVKPATGGN